MTLVYRLPVLILLLCSGSLWAQRFAPKFYATIDITDMGQAGLDEIKVTPGVAWWIEMDRNLLVLADRFSLAQLDDHHAVTRLNIPVRTDRLFFVKRAHYKTLATLDAHVLGYGGRYAVIQSRSDQAPQLQQHQHAESAAAHEVHAEVVPFSPNTVLARRARNGGPMVLPAKRAEIAALVDQVDGYRWFADLHKLSCLNRNTRGSDIAEATQWLVDNFSEMPGLTVSTPEFQFGNTSAQNVMAVLEGSERPDEWYIVGAHYDSTSQDPLNQAPGAEDNASGTAGVLELARILSQYRPAATIVFMCYSGEEQGLFGSAAHVNNLQSSGDSSKVKAVFTFDMIGYTRDETLDCLLETGPVGEFLFEPLMAAAANYTNLNIITTLNPFGSDHVPYLNANIPAMLTIENDWNNYPGYHRTNDLADWLGVEMGTGVIRMNLAVLAEMAGPIADPSDTALQPVSVSHEVSANKH